MKMTTAQKSSNWLFPFWGMVAAQLTGGFLATFAFGGLTRTTVFLVVFPLITLLLCTLPSFQTRFGLVIVFASIFLSLGIIHFFRKGLDPTAILGPVPPSMELPTLSGLFFLAAGCAFCTRFAFSLEGKLRHARWPLVGFMVASLVGLAVLAKQTAPDLSPSGLLRRVSAWENHHEFDPTRLQELSVLLAFCGRDAEAESVSQTLASGEKPSPGQSAKIDPDKYLLKPWRKAFREIAKREQLILIMEAHNAPKHRQWIEQTLRILHEEGFRDYAAEALAETGTSLKRRGYPVPLTGYYVSDPHFGNVLRSAIDFNFDIHAYEADDHENTMEQREEGQASKLAQLFAANPRLKLVVHAGYGHIFKTTREGEIKMMAHHLWELTGIQPFCIWQMYHSPEDGNARQLSRLLPAESEPMMVIPPPDGLDDFQFRFLPGAVDALVVHPARTGGPGQRIHGFTATRQQVKGIWQGSEEAVLIGAFKKGETAEAIALDQVMLRWGEKEFVLWVPDDNFEIRIFNANGRVNPLNADGVPLLRLTR